MCAAGAQSAAEEAAALDVERASYVALRELEDAALESRAGAAAAEAGDVAERETELQARYAHLLEEAHAAAAAGGSSA